MEPSLSWLKNQKWPWAFGLVTMYIPHTCLILKTDAFHCILGMDFINSNLCIKSSEFSPHRLVIKNALGQLENVALTE